jgi:hypothetical protein
MHNPSTDRLIRANQFENRFCPSCKRCRPKMTRLGLCSGTATGWPLDVAISGKRQELRLISTFRARTSRIEFVIFATDQNHAVLQPRVKTFGSMCVLQDRLLTPSSCASLVCLACFFHCEMDGISNFWNGSSRLPWLPSLARIEARTVCWVKCMSSFGHQAIAWICLRETTGVGSRALFSTGTDIALRVCWNIQRVLSVGCTFRLHETCLGNSMEDDWLSVGHETRTDASCAAVCAAKSCMKTAS